MSAIISDNKPMKKELTDRMVGILGGIGPEATLDLYRHIIQLTPAAIDQDHIRVLIYSNPKIPDRTRAIVENGESPLSSLIESAQLLERGGAQIIAMPCNTSHHYFTQIQEKVKTPILNMIEETCRTLHSQMPGVKVAGLLATVGTLQSKIYERALGGIGVEVLAPDAFEQARIQAAIDQVKAGIHSQSIRDLFESAGLRLARSGAQVVILGCTEIPLVFEPERMEYPTLNTTLILAQAVVDWALGRR
jgi:aspartate racemase